MFLLFKKFRRLFSVFLILSPTFVFAMQNQKLLENKNTDGYEVLFAPGVIQGKNNFKVSEVDNDGVGLGDSWKKVFLKEVEAVDFPNIVSRDYNSTTFGAKDETDVLEAKFKELKKDGKKVLLAGNSRGTFVVLNGNFEGAAGLFVQTSAGSMEDIVDNYLKMFKCRWIPGANSLISKIIIPIFMYQSYRPWGPKPIDRVERIPKDMPIFIACTEQDHGGTEMNANCSAKLVKRLLETGHTKVYFYCVPEGSHCCMYDYSYGMNKGFAETKGQEYANVSQAFMKKIGLLDPKHDCKGGDELLEKCKVPNIERARELMGRYDPTANRDAWIKKAITFAAIGIGAYFLGKRFSKSNLYKKFINSKAYKNWLRRQRIKRRYPWAIVDSF